VLGLALLDSDVRDVDHAGVEPPGRDDDADLRGVHRHRDVRPYRRTGDLTCRRIDSGRKIDGNDRNPGAVDPVDQGGRVGTRLAAKACSEQRIDDDVRRVMQLLADVPSRRL
jgi:hypothetical protein